MKTKILVIEDNEQNIYLMTYILENRGYEVIPARDGLEGIKLAKKTVPSLILLDIQLPEMDGYSVARELKADQAFDGVPIVAVTSYAMPGDRELCLESGCSGYIEKPINPDTFMDEIKQYLPTDKSDRGDDV